MPEQEYRVGIIQAITSPLGFFALSLFIVEGFLSIVTIFSDLDAQNKFYGMLIGAGLFILVVSGVWLLVWFRAEHLTFGEKSHLKRLELQKAWGTSTSPETKRDADDTPVLPNV